LVWGFLCQGCITPFGASRHFCRALLLHSLLDPRREHSSVPTASPSRTLTVTDGASSAPPKGLSFTNASTAAGCPFATRRQAARDPGGCHAMIRGEPAIGHEQSRATPACIRLNPYRVPTMKQSYASAGKAPRRRVHSPSGIVAIAVCGLPPPRIVIGYRASKRSQVPNPVFVLSRLHYCSRRRPQLDTVRYLTGRDQAPQRDQQLARQCHDHCRLACAVRPLGPHAIPPRQRTVFLEH